MRTLSTFLLTLCMLTNVAAQDKTTGFRPPAVPLVTWNDDAARKSFVEHGKLPSEDDLRMPRPARDQWPVLALMFDLGNVGKSPVERHL